MNLFVRCALVGLWFGPSTVAATAEEAASMCRCQGDRGANFDRIQQVLGEPLKATGLEFTEEPLENVVNFLQDEYEIPIQIDERAIENAGLTRDEAMTIQIRNVSLRSALRLMLKLKQLTYVIRNEVLIITTPKEAEAHLLACVYDVRDIIGQNRGNKDISALKDAIVKCVAMETWAVNGGGEAEIKSLQPGLLVISQIQEVHEDIGEFLTLIRETLQRPPIEVARGVPGMSRGGRGMEMGGGYGMGMGGRGGEGGFGKYGGESGMGREAEPTPATDDPFGP